MRIIVYYIAGGLAFIDNRHFYIIINNESPD